MLCVAELFTALTGAVLTAAYLTSKTSANVNSTSTESQPPNSTAAGTRQPATEPLVYPVLMFLPAISLLPVLFFFLYRWRRG